MVYDEPPALTQKLPCLAEREICRVFVGSGVDRQILLTQIFYIFDIWGHKYCWLTALH